MRQELQETPELLVLLELEPLDPLELELESLGLELDPLEQEAWDLLGSSE